MLRFSPRPNKAELIRWREWGEDAFKEAAEQNKLIAIFITAFWCGFCQRMDETSLSEDDVSALLNAFFIPIRVEESQRPDVDLRYNQNGWPTISFFTPQGVHLASVNYTPPEDFVGVLARVVDHYQQNREALLSLEPEAPSVVRGEDVPLTPALVEEVAGILEGLADHEYGGYGLDLKLLHTEANEFAFYLYESRAEHAQLDHVARTLTKLHQSRTFDALNGGFFRYSSRRDWQEPHPEKLLGDQAALLSNYLDTYLLTGNDFYRQVAEGLITYLEDTLTTDEIRPCFAGCQDYLHGSEPTANDEAQTQFILDGLVYCDANAAAASAYLKAWCLLGNQKCRTRAEEIVDFLWSNLRQADGGFAHYWNGEPFVPGLLKDAVALGDALLNAYTTLGGAEYLEHAREVAAYVVEKHRCPDGGFFDISETGPAKLGVPLTLMAENAEAALFFVRLAALSGEPSYRDQATWALKRIPNTHREYGAFAAAFGHALARLFSAPVVVNLVGPPGVPETLALLRAARTQLLHPNLVVRFQEPSGQGRPGAWLSITQGQSALGPFTQPESIGSNLLVSN